MLAWLTKLLENTTTPIGTVVHIGAGVDSELLVYQKLNCERILAVEPDDSLFKKLRTKAKRFDNVTALQAWIADTASERSAAIFANLRFNSLLPADKMLLEHFPNVQTIKALNVKTESFENIVTSHIKQIDEKSNVLVFEVQGFETALFKNSKPNTLQLFNWIVVRTSEKSLFECGATATEVKQSLTEQGFELRLSDTSQLPFVEQYYQLNTSKVELKIVKDQLVTTNNEFSSQTQKLAENNQLVAQKDVLNTQLEEKLNTSIARNNKLQTTLVELQHELKSNNENNSQLKQKNDSSQQDLKKRIKQIEWLNEKIGELTALKLKVDDERKNAADSNVELKQQIISLDKSKQDNESQFELLKIKLGGLTTQLDASEIVFAESQKNLKEQSHWHQENRKWAKNLQDQLKEKNDLFEELQKDFYAASVLSSKLVFKAQVDIESLRKKYHSKMNSERQLLELVKELRNKLEMAANYYFQLQKIYLELIEINICDTEGPNFK